jgi:ferrochelatase
MTTAAPIGVTLLNLGGPASEKEIPLFMHAVLSDPEIVSLPWPFRPVLARLIVWRRRAVVTEHYRAIGGKSPIAEQTQAQINALQQELGTDFLVRFVFRHSAPRAATVVHELAAAGIRRIIALPAYPHWSKTTTRSAIRDIENAAAEHHLAVQSVNSYQTAAGFLETWAQQTAKCLTGDTHVIFSAHGQLARDVRRGDPYTQQVRETVAALSSRLPAGVSSSLAFQSRVGPLEWTKPSLSEEIRRVGSIGCRALVVAPISFTCENLETLFELDIEMAELAKACGIPSYTRVSTPGCHPAFIRTLAELVRNAVTGVPLSAREVRHAC